MAYENHHLNMIQKMGKTDSQIKVMEKERVSVEKAIEQMKTVFERFHNRFGASINKSSGEILNKLTDGKYLDMFITKEFDVKLKDQISSEIQSAEFFSNGTWDQIYFALRMGIIQSISEKLGKEIPLLLDDALIQYDDKRLKNALKYLNEYGQENQVLLFTCQNREVEISQSFENVNIIKI